MQTALVDDDATIPVERLTLGGSLRERISAALSPAQALDYLLRIALALEALHRSGSMHGNLKPWNVVFRADGALVLAGQRGVRALEEQPLARANMTAAAARYLSPESVRGLPLDHRHDLYCLGVIAWEMLTGGRPLFAGQSATAVMCRHLSASVPQVPLQMLRFQPVLDRLLAKERADRYTSALELANDLRARFADVFAVPPGESAEPLDGARAA